MRDRVPQLDALRGLAAATVVCHHWHNAFSVGRPTWWLAPFLAGHEAVILFFVLSGYVLSLPVWTSRMPPYPTYLVRRITRIYLPYVAAMLISAVGCALFFGHHLQGVSYWYYLTWQQPVTAGMLWNQALMDPAPLLNTAFWSLRYEMQMSLIFPFLCLLMLRLGRVSGITLLLAVRIAGSLMNSAGFAQNPYLLTLYYAFFFIAGATLARHRRMLLDLVQRASLPILWALFGAALAAYFWGAFLFNNQRQIDLLAGAASVAIILLIQDPRLTVGLRSRFAGYLGRISYSSYLVHGTVLFAVLDTLYGRGPAWLVFLLYATLSFAAAHLFCIAVEEPSMRLGKRLTASARRDAAAPALAG